MNTSINILQAEALINKIRTIKNDIEKYERELLNLEDQKSFYEQELYELTHLLTSYKQKL